MSDGFGPSTNIHLPKETQHQHHEQTFNTHSPPPRRRSALTLRHFIMLVIAAILTATGLVSIEDIAFVIFSLPYVYFLSKFSFPSLSPTMQGGLFRGNKIMGYYVSGTAIIGLLLPILYISEGFLQGDKEGIKTAASHLFLLVSQVFMEGVTYCEEFSLPIWVFVPVFYNSRRIFSLVDWMRAEFLKSGNTMRLYFGRGIAIANMVLWCFNLFGFLLPVFLPKAFEKYYGCKVKD